jgi:ABC-2 type transport system permease protein
VVGADLLAAVVRLPAVWVLVAASLALYGLPPTAPLAWPCWSGVLAREIGPLLDLPRWVRTSPFTHVPPLPGGR